jgi:hypothetical protein
LHHDIAGPHAAATTIQTIQNLEFTVLPHPPYCSDLTPCNFHAFSPLKKVLHSRWFGSDEEVKAEVYTWIQEQLKTCSSTGTRKFVDKYKQCVCGTAGRLCGKQ